MKKIISTLLSLGVAATLFVGCGGGGGTTTKAPDGTTAAPDGGGDIVVASWNDAADAMTDIAEAYNAQNTKIPGKVTVQYVDSDYAQLRPSLISGQGVPDIFQTQNRDFPAFMNTYGDVFLDVTDIVKPEEANFAEAPLSMVKHATDGKYYAVPWDVGPSAWMYRVDVFEEAGVNVEDVKTWDDYIEMGKTIKEKTGKYVFGYPLSFSGMPDEIYLYLQQQNGQFIDAEGKVNLNTPEMVKAFETLLKAREEGVVLDLPDVWNDRIKAAAADELVSLPYAVWYVGTMKNSIADSAGKWRITGLPGFKGLGENASIGGSILAISKTTKNPELAKDFLKFALMTDAGNDINLEYGLFTSYAPSYNSAAYKAVEPYFGEQSYAEEFAKHVDSPVMNFGTNFTTISAQMELAGAEIMGGADIAETLQKYSDIAQAQIDQLNG